MPSSKLSLLERLLSLVTPINAGEGRNVLVMMLYAFVLLLLWYLLRTVREAVILSESGAVLRSYAHAFTAGALIILIPIYCTVVKRFDKTRFLQLISIFFAANLLIFIAIALLDLKYGFAFVIWTGIFGVGMIAQFWAFAAETYSVGAGQRLFVAIALGALLGSLAGSIIANTLFPILNSEGMMLLAATLLAALYFLPPAATRTVPDDIRNLRTEYTSTPPAHRHLPGGFDVVWSSRYLTLIALFVIGLNVVTTMSGFILASMVTERAAVFASTTVITKEVWIGSFYGDLYFWTNLCGLLIQGLLVSRLIQKIGILGAFLLTPFIAVILFGVLIFIPVFAFMRLAEIIQSSLNYSLRQTTHQSLFLPTDRAATFEGKTTIDTFFWRFGDLLQAGVVFLGTSIFGFGTHGFIIFNFFLAIIWLGLALFVLRPYRIIMFGYNRETVRTERLVAYEEYVQTRENYAGP